MIHVEGLRLSFSGRSVLNLPEWRVEARRHCLVIGPSGSGKTSLLNILAGLLSPASGRVSVAGREISAMPGRERDAFRGRNVGIVFQDLHLVGPLTVRGNLELAPYMAGSRSENGRVDGLLHDLDLTALADKRARSLSRGEAQRVAIGRAVINRPKLILADEPTSSLDDRNCRRTMDLFLRQAEETEATLVIATHDIRLRDWFPQHLTLEDTS